MRRVVVLPQPDGPSNPKNSPWLTSRDTSATARVVPKLRERFLSERSGIFRAIHRLHRFVLSNLCNLWMGFFFFHESQCPSILTNHSHSCARGPSRAACV